MAALLSVADALARVLDGVDPLPREDAPLTEADGRVEGTYVHGLFTGDAFRKAWLARFGIASVLAYEARIEMALDALADHLEAHLYIAQLVQIARRRQTTSASAA